MIVGIVDDMEELQQVTTNLIINMDVEITREQKEVAIAAAGNVVVCCMLHNCLDEVH